MTLPVADEFQKAYGHFPAFAGFTAYDAVQILADAMQRAGSTDPDKIVAEMEKTNMEGTLGQHRVLWPQRHRYPCDEVRPRIHHRHVHAVAGRQAGLHLAGATSARTS